jgi:hypothetical protein
MDWRCELPPPTADDEDDTTAGCTKVCRESDAAVVVSKAVISDTGCECSALANASDENDDGNDEVGADKGSNGGGRGCVARVEMDDCDGRKERKDDRAEPGLEVPVILPDDGAAARVRREWSAGVKEA